MRNQRYQNYFDEEVLAAHPVKLIHLLYRGALDSIASARRYLKLGDIRARSRAVTKAMRIITELSHSLNREEGGEVSGNLADLYAYIETLLIRANIEQSDPPLAEAEKLLGSLAEAWEAHTSEPVPEERHADTYEPVSCAC